MNNQDNQLEFLSPGMSVSMSDDWFEFAQPDHFWMQWRFGVLKKYFSLIPGKTESLFEIGCGNATVRDQVEGEGYVVDGCDLNIGSMQMAKRGKGRLMVYNIFDQRTELLKKYPAILLMDVIEHIEDDHTFLKVAMQYVKPGGLVFINVPASMALYSRFDKEAGHYRRFDKRMMKQLFDDVGLELVVVRYWAFLLIPFAFMRKIVTRFMKKNVIKTGFEPPNAFAHAVFRCLMNIELRLPDPIYGTSVFAIGRVKQISESPHDLV